MSNYTSTANIVLSVNGKQAQKMLQSLEKDAAKLEKQIEAAAAAGDKVKLKKLQKELSQTQRQMQQLKGTTNSVETTLQRLDKATPKELNKALRQLQQQLNGIERGSDAWDTHIEKIKAVKEEIAKMNEAMRPDEDLMDRINEWWEKWQTAIVGAGAVITGLVMAARQAVNAYAEMEQEMANVRKFTGMTAEEVEQLNEEFRKMDTRTSREDLNKLAQEAGRLGKNSVEDVLGFVRAADKINVALDDLGDGATLTLSKLTGIFGDEKRLGTEKSLLAVGSVINELSQNCSASAPYLAEFASRMGGVGSQAGMTVQQIMAFAAVLDSNNQACEASATALSQVITRIYQDPAKYAKVAGMDVARFANLVKTDMNAALIEFFGTLNKAGSMDVLSPMFKDMGENGARAISAMSTLAARVEDLKWQQNNANVAFAEAKSIGIEFDVQNNTVQAGLEKAQKSVHELAVELGEKLQPAMKFCISSSTMTLKVLSAVVDFLMKYGREVVVLVGSIALYNAALFVMNSRTLIAAAATKAFNAALAFGSKAVPALRTLLVSLTNGIQFFSNGLRVNVAMQERWRRAMAAMKFSNWLGLILALGSAIYLLAKRFRESATEADKANQAFQDIEREAQSSTATQIRLLDELYNKTQNQTLATDERLAALNRIRQIYPDYFKDISDEAFLAGKAADAYVALKNAILESARAKGRENRIAKLEEEIGILEDEYMKKAAPFLKTAMQRQQDFLLNPERLANDPQYRQAQAALGVLQRTYKPQIEERKKLQSQLAGQNADYEIANGTTETTIADQFTNLGNGDGSGGGGSSDRFAKEKEWRERAEAEARIAYARGETDYIDHTDRMNRILVEYYDMLLSRTDLGETERLTLTAEQLEAQAKLSEREGARFADDEERRYSSRIAELKQFYLDGSISKEAFDLKVEEAEIEHQSNLAEIHAQGSRERLQAEERLSQLLMAQMERRQAELRRKEQEYADIKKEFFGENPQERQAAFDNAMSALQVVYDRELAAAGDNAAERLRIEEAFQVARLALRRRFGLASEEEEENALKRWVAASKSWLDGEGGKALTGTMDSLVSGMSAIFSQLSTIMQADLEVQTAAITKRYDAEISAAEGNSYKVKQLEKQKQEEIAKAKNEANRKMFAMQVIQAVAQTAQNAISAYGSAAAVPLVGYILAPVAASMAVAAGMLQIAAIKKQQQASEAQGYSRGGFTKPGRVDEPAGVVHAGEWVASQKLVNSPRTRPLIDALEYAQRTNTIGSLSMDDVSRSITAPIVLASNRQQSQQVVVQAPPASVIVQDNPELTSTLRELKLRLSEPFVTVNTVSGDHGIQKAQDDYAALLRNKSPKSKR